MRQLRYLWLLFTAVLVLALAACASTIGGMRADAEAAAQTLRTYTQQTTRLLQADLVTKAEAQKRLAIIEQARSSLREVERQLNACETAGQQTCEAARIALATSRSTLNQVELWLIDQQKRSKP